MGKTNKRSRKRASRLRKAVRLRDSFTCQSPTCENPTPCPVGNQCYQTLPNNPKIKGKCSRQLEELDASEDKYDGWRKTECPLQVHHIIPYFKLKHRSLNIIEEAECCTLLCSVCHSDEHNKSNNSLSNI